MDEITRPYDFIEAYLIPAFNTADDITEADYLTAGFGDTEVMTIRLDSGATFHMTVVAVEG